MESTFICFDNVVTECLVASILATRSPFMSRAWCDWSSLLLVYEMNIWNICEWIEQTNNGWIWMHYQLTTSGACQPIRRVLCLFQKTLTVRIYCWEWEGNKKTFIIKRALSHSLSLFLSDCSMLCIYILSIHFVFVFVILFTRSHYTTQKECAMSVWLVMVLAGLAAQLAVVVCFWLLSLRIYLQNTTHSMDSQLLKFSLQQFSRDHISGDIQCMYVSCVLWIEAESVLLNTKHYWVFWPFSWCRKATIQIQLNMKYTVGAGGNFWSGCLQRNLCCICICRYSHAMARQQKKMLCNIRTIWYIHSNCCVDYDNYIHIAQFLYQFIIFAVNSSIHSQLFGNLHKNTMQIL